MKLMNMMRIRYSTPLLLLFLLILTACGSGATGTASQPPELPTTTPRVEVVVVTSVPSPTPTDVPPSGPLATAAALSASVTLTFPTETATPEDMPAPDDYTAILRQAWNIVNDNYVRGNFNGVDWEGVLEAYLPRLQAIDNQEDFWDLMQEFMLELGDNHSRFVRPDQFASEFDLPSDQQGLPWTGFQVWPAREDEQFFIWYVCSFGPAADAGLQRGDAILAVDGDPITKTDEGFDRAFRRRTMFGDGSSDRVTLTVQRGAARDPEEITLRLGGAAGCDGWRWGFLNQDPLIGYVRVPDFSGDTDVNILNAIEELEQDQPLDGLIVDVRHNPGGNSDRSIAVFTTGTFGLIGPLREGATQTIYRIRGPVKWNETTPMAVVTDGSSHSAAEYFATAMQQAGRATLVGMPTAGNTEGITGFNLADGSLIRLAVMTLQLPDGSTLENVGVIPDIQVDLGKWGLREDPDLQLQEALEDLIRRVN